MGARLSATSPSLHHLDAVRDRCRCPRPDRHWRRDPRSSGEWPCIVKPASSPAWTISTMRWRRRPPHVVHHLSDAHNAWPAEHFDHLGRAKVRTGCLPARHRRDATGDCDIDTQRQPLAALNHPTHAFHSQHVCDLVGIDDMDIMRAFRQPGSIVRRCDHSALDMFEMGVHNPGAAQRPEPSITCSASSAKLPAAPTTAILSA